MLSQWVNKYTTKKNLTYLYWNSGSPKSQSMNSQLKKHLNICVWTYFNYK